MAASREPSRLPLDLASLPTSSTPGPDAGLERATLRLVTGEPITVALPKLRPWFGPGEKKAAKVRRRMVRRAARRHLENRTR